MRQYYYSVSVLPALLFDEIPFFSADEFLEHCATFVSPADMDVIRSACLGGESGGSGALTRWNEFATDIRFYLARLRAGALGWDTETLPEPAGSDPRLGDFARQLTQQDNVRKAELALLRRMWEFLDEIELGHFFDRDALVIYYLRLQIAARRATLTDDEAGSAEFTRQYEEVAQTTMEIV